MADHLQFSQLTNNIYELWELQGGKVNEMLMREQNCTQASAFANSNHPVCSSLSHDPASFRHLFCETTLLALPLLVVLGATAFADIVEGGFALGEVPFAAQ